MEDQIMQRRGIYAGSYRRGMGQVNAGKPSVFLVIMSRPRVGPDLNFHRPNCRRDFFAWHFFSSSYFVMGFRQRAANLRQFLQEARGHGYEGLPNPRGNKTRWTKTLAGYS